MFLDIGPTITGTETTGEIAERRCFRVEQDNSKRSKCPSGGQEILNSILRQFGFNIPVSDYDDTFRVPVRIQDDGQGHSLSISNGNIKTTISQEKFTEKTEISPSDFTASERTDLPWEIKLSNKTKWVPDTVLSVILSGSVLNEQGESVFKPLTQFSGNILYLQYKVFADLMITYKATTNTNEIEIQPTNDPENNYQSQLLISSECGGLARFDVEVPDCFKNSLDIDDSDDSDDSATIKKETIKGADLYVDVNICTKEVTERIVPK